jgi:hypothetical protein
LKKPQGYWKNWSNVESELNNSFGEFISIGILPSSDMIKTNCSLYSAIQKYFGGMKGLSERIKCTSKSFYQCPDGHYVNSGNELIVDWFLSSRGIAHEVNGIINEKYGFRYDFKVGKYYIEIWGFSRPEYYQVKKIKCSIYKKLNLNLISLEKDFFAKPLKMIESNLNDLFSQLGFDITSKDSTYNGDINNSIKHFFYWTFENTLKELKSVIEDIGHFPRCKELTKIGKSSLGMAMNRYGGYKRFRNIVGEPDDRRGKYHYSKEVVIDELKEIITNIGDFPTYEYLCSIKKSTLCDCMRKYGGFNFFRESLGYKPLKISNGYWEIKKNVIDKLSDIINSIGHFPSQKELLTMKMSALSNAISRHHGGMKAIKTYFT